MKFPSRVKIAVTAISALAIITTFMSCSKKDENSSPFVKIGGKTFSMAEFKSFSAMQFNHHDLVKKGFFPGDRFAPTLFIETELLYKEAKKYSSQVTNSKEWDWKKEFVLGQYFSRNVIRMNLGATDEQLQKYFKENKGKILYESNSRNDTSYSANFQKIADSYFVTQFPPTEEFKKANANVQGDQLNKFWKDTKLKDPLVFFRDAYYQEFYKKPYPKDYTAFYGNGKEITPEDLAIVSEWLPEESRTRLKEGRGVADIVNYMMSWKLFAMKAKEMGVNNEKEFLRQIKWYEKYEVVRHYENTILYDKLMADRSDINPEMVQYALWDQKGSNLSTSTDSNLVNRIVDETVKLKTDAKLLEHIYKLRKKKKVTFLNSDYKDELAKSSERVLFEADSLYNAANKEMAKKTYTELVRNYPFTKEGVEAYRNLGMIDADEGSYTSAIRSYRNYLLLSQPNDEWCKVFFMIAYAYGENLSNIGLAAANYRWVLKNRPDCDFADDAEFMYLHLGEPVSDVDDIVAENARQGRTETK